jgi:hypothetical protein
MKLLNCLYFKLEVCKPDFIRDFSPRYTSSVGVVNLVDSLIKVDLEILTTFKMKVKFLKFCSMDDRNC